MTFADRGGIWVNSMARDYSFFILFSFFSGCFFVDSSISSRSLNRFMNYFIYIVWLPTLNGMFSSMLDELFQLRREIIRR